MLKSKDWLEGIVGESIAWVIGWFVCITVLIGAYSLGRWAAPFLGWEFNADSVGLLSAFTFLWIYEHRNIEHKYDRLRDLLDMLGTQN